MIESFDTKFFASLESPIDRCDFLWNHYISRKRDDAYEPSWVLKPYALVKKFLESQTLDEKELFVLNETIKSHLQKDGSEVPVKTGFPNEGSRIMHDCWKAGSFTWIFMNRKETKDIFSHKEFIVISRTLPDDLYELIDKDEFAPQTLFAAYHTNDETRNIGPAVCLDDILQELEDKNV